MEIYRGAEPLSHSVLNVYAWFDFYEAGTAGRETRLPPHSRPAPTTGEMQGKTSAGAKKPR